MKVSHRGGEGRGAQLADADDARSAPRGVAAAHMLFDLAVTPLCIFRPILTARFGIVTAEFGNMNNRFGDVTDGILKAAGRRLAAC